MSANPPTEPEGFVVCGAGGHGKVVADLVRALGHRVVGYLDGDPGKLGQVVEPGGATVVGLQGDPAALRDRPAAHLAVAVGDNDRRLAWLGELGDARCPALVHPSAVVSPSARIGAGTVVFPGAVVNADTSIGRGVIVNTGAVVEHDCVIGDGVHVSPRATICGGVRVGALSWIAAGSVVIPGCVVGEHAVVGAGAVVLVDVADHATVVGNPARPVRPVGGV